MIQDEVLQAEAAKAEPDRERRGCKRQIDGDQGALHRGSVQQFVKQRNLQFGRFQARDSPGLTRDKASQ